jgi:hypothetical protein
MSCSSYALVRYDGPYEGRIIDADTGQPIEGVVVLGIWNTETPSAAGALTNYHDAMETVTDKSGEFTIKGLGLLFMSNVLPMDVVIFKAGYTYYGLMTWKELKRAVKKEDNRLIIRLKKFTIEERRNQGGPPDPPSEAPLKKVILMLQEIDRDDKERGLKARGIWNGVRYE